MSYAPQLTPEEYWINRGPVMTVSNKSYWEVRLRQENVTMVVATELDRAQAGPIEHNTRKSIIDRKDQGESTYLVVFELSKPIFIDTSEVTVTEKTYPPLAV